jgi:hypothetical protein
MLEPSTGASGSVATRDAVVQPDPPSAPAENKGDAMDVDESSVPSASGAPADAAPSSASVPVPPEDWLSITFKWSGKSYDLRISTSDL